MFLELCYLFSCYFVSLFWSSDRVFGLVNVRVLSCSSPVILNSLNVVAER
jgi:hypothetical protein